MKTGKSILLVFALLLYVITPVFSQEIPDRPVPPRLVNDFAEV